MDKDVDRRKVLKVGLATGLAALSSRSHSQGEARHFPAEVKDELAKSIINESELVIDRASAKLNGISIVVLRKKELSQQEIDDLRRNLSDARNEIAIMIGIIIRARDRSDGRKSKAGTDALQGLIATFSDKDRLLGEATQQFFRTYVREEKK
jgi:hypothetical protein